MFSSKAILYYKSLNLKDKLEKQKDLKNELNLLSALNDYKQLINFNFDCFNDIYGIRNCEEITNFCKSYAIKEYFINNTKKNYSFEDLEKAFNLSFDDIEELIIDGNNNAMFKTNINYENKSIKLLYAQKGNYSKEEINKLKDDVNNLKNKIEIIYKAIDKV